MRTGRAFCVLVVLVLGFAMGYGQEKAANHNTAEILTVEFSLLTFVPGDTVKASLRLACEPGSWYKEKLVFDPLLAQEAKPDPEDDGPSILSATLEGDGAEALLSIYFIPWKSGTYWFPGLEIGGLIVPGFKFDCGSSLGKGLIGEPEALGQLEPGALVFKLYVLGAGFILLVSLSALLWFKLIPAFKAFLLKNSFKRIRKNFDTILAGLSGSSSASWSILCAALRDFCDSRLGLGIKALTVTEIRSLQKAAVPATVFVELAELLAMGDKVRYGGKTGLEAAMAVVRAMELADRIDASIKAEA